MITIRKERPPDAAAREALLDEAFGRSAGAKALNASAMAARPQKVLPLLRPTECASWAPPGSGPFRAVLANRPCCWDRWRSRPVTGAAVSVQRSYRTPSAWHARAGTPPSSSSATRPIMAASDFRPRKPRLYGCQDPSNGIASSVLNSCPARLTACVAFCALEGTPSRPLWPHRPPDSPSKYRGRRCGFCTAAIPFALRHRYDEPSWRG